MSNVQYTWQPTLQNSIQDKVSLAKTVIASTLKISKISSKTTTDKHSGLVMTLQRLFDYKYRNGSGILHPYFFIWYFKMLEYSKLDDNSQLSAHFDKLEEVENHILQSFKRAEKNLKSIGLSIDLHLNEDYYKPFFRRAEQMTVESIKDPNVITPLQPIPEDHLNLLRASFLVMEQHWREIYDEIQDTVQMFTFFTAKNTIGFADFHCHGSICLTSKNLWTGKPYTPEELAVEIIHEAAHVRLNTIMGSVKLFSNKSNETYLTPLRQDPRPMSGLFHQMFVLRRLKHFYLCLAKNDKSFEKDYEKCENDFQDALDTVKTYAKLTPEGESLIAYIQ